MERPPAVAGSFYESDPSILSENVTDYLDSAELTTTPHSSLRALIVPHAGYIYSGPVAASAYSLLRSGSPRPRRVLLLGPSHFVPLSGHALPSVESFRTPLGSIPIDTSAVSDLSSSFDHVTIDDQPHTREHSLEVQLPFLQAVLEASFTLIPVATGHTTAASTADLIESLWTDSDTLTVISTDLSHYLEYGQARRVDEKTATHIDALDRTDFGPEEACGCHPLNGIVEAARREGLRATRLDLRNSGDTAGPRDRVVGYGAWVIG